MFDEEIVEIDVCEFIVDVLCGMLVVCDVCSVDVLWMDCLVWVVVNFEMVIGEFVVCEDSEVVFFLLVMGG